MEKAHLEYLSLSFLNTDTISPLQCQISLEDSSCMEGFFIYFNIHTFAKSLKMYMDIIVDLSKKFISVYLKTLKYFYLSTSAVINV